MVTDEDDNLSLIINTSADQMVFDTAQSSSSKKSKEYFYIFCNKLITKFARHIQLVHSDLTMVKCILKLPKGKYNSHFLAKR